ncbi:MAG: hypothetical protein IIB27_03385 [Chloroflexi bacterium]|nr:hypothetical protein [Chloroflexota bacterium]
MMETLRTWQLLRTLLRNVQQTQGYFEQLQDKQLRRAVAYAAKHVPFYRRVWREVGFDAERFGGLRDLQRIPVFPNDFVKEAARQGELLADDVNTAHCTYIESSGSSGETLRTWKRPLEERLRRAIGLRTWFEHGFRWGDMTAQFQTRAGPSHVLQRVGMSRKAWISTANPLDDQLDQFLRSKADVIVGAPTALRHLCHAIEACGEKPKKPKIIFCAGEVIDTETGDVVVTFSLSTPTADITIASDEIGVLGKVRAGLDLLDTRSPSDAPAAR